MAYSHTNSKGVTYYLHSTEVTLRGGKPQTIFFFAKVEKNEKGQPVDLPADRVVKDNPRNGFLTEVVALLYQCNASLLGKVCKQPFHSFPSVIVFTLKRLLHHKRFEPILRSNKQVPKHPLSPGVFFVYRDKW